MTLKEWLKDVYYDQWGQYLWSRQDEEGGSQMVGEIRGWGALQNEFKTEEEASAFQDQVGKFIAAAINEKVQRDLLKEFVLKIVDNQTDIPPDFNQIITDNFNDLV
jgi:hypothetical protein